MRTIIFLSFFWINNAVERPYVKCPVFWELSWINERERKILLHLVVCCCDFCHFLFINTFTAAYLQRCCYLARFCKRLSLEHTKISVLSTDQLSNGTSRIGGLVFFSFIIFLFWFATALPLLRETWKIDVHSMGARGTRNNSCKSVCRVLYPRSCLPVKILATFISVMHFVKRANKNFYFNNGSIAQMG